MQVPQSGLPPEGRVSFPFSFFLFFDYTDFLTSISISGACERCRKAKRKCALTKEETETKTGKRKDRGEPEGSPRKKARSEGGKERSRTEERRPEAGSDWRTRMERRLEELERRMEEGFRRVIEEIRDSYETDESDADADGDEE